MHVVGIDDDVFLRSVFCETPKHLLALGDERQ